MRTDVTKEWLERRGSLNHDWLKNKYLLGLRAFTTRLEQGHPNLPFLEVRFHSWKDRRYEISWLLSHFAQAMSPRSLFESPPLNHCDAGTQLWLGILADHLWRARYPDETDVEPVRFRYETANVTYERIVEQLGEIRLPENANHLTTLLPDFLAFLDECRQLSEAISRLPPKILVT